MMWLLFFACWQSLNTFTEACENLNALSCECQDGHLVGAATEEWESACEESPPMCDNAEEEPMAWNLDFHNCYQKELTKDCDEKAAREACAEFNQ